MQCQLVNREYLHLCYKLTLHLLTMERTDFILNFFAYFIILVFKILDGHAAFTWQCISF